MIKLVRYYLIIITIIVSFICIYLFIITKDTLVAVLGILTIVYNIFIIDKYKK